MSLLGGIASSAVSNLLGGQSVIIKPKRQIAAIPIAQVTIEEQHDDEIEISDHPIERGAPITDHAFKRPATVTIRCGWSNSPAAGGGGGLNLGGGLSGLTAQLKGAATSAAVNAIQGAGVAALTGGSIGGAISGAVSNGVQSLLGGSAPKQVKDIYEQLQTLQKSFIPFDVLTGKRAYKNMLFKSLRISTTVETENSLVITAVLREVILVSVKPLSVSAVPANQKAPAKTNPLQSLGLKSLAGAVGINLSVGGIASAVLDAATSKLTIGNLISKVKL